MIRAVARGCQVELSMMVGQRGSNQALVSARVRMMEQYFMILFLNPFFFFVARLALVLGVFLGVSEARPTPEPSVSRVSTVAFIGVVAHADVRG